MLLNKRFLQQAASRLRSSYGMSPIEPIRLKSWLLKLEIVAVFKSMSDSFSGMAIRQNDHRFMLINSNHRMGKQHFTVAHELYHLFIQEGFNYEVSNAGRFDKSDPNEYNADWFAAYLLMPEEGLLSLIPPHELGKNKISLPTIVKIEQYYACSRTALLVRLSDMGLIKFSDYEDYKKNVINSARLLGYDTDLYMPANDGMIIGNYGVMAKELYDKEIISESHYTSLMNDLGIEISLAEEENGQE